MNGVAGRSIPSAGWLADPAGPEGTFLPGGGGLDHDHDHSAHID